MAIQTKAINGNSVRNNGGVVLGGGNIGTNAPITNAPSNKSMGVPNKDGPSNTIGVNSTGVFTNRVFQYQGSHKFPGPLQTNEVAGVVDNDVVTPGNPASSPVDAIHDKVTQRSLLQRTAGWNWATGALLSTPTNQNDTYKSADGGSTVDYAAVPSRSVPGQLVYMQGSPTPKSDNYKAKTGG